MALLPLVLLLTPVCCVLPTADPDLGPPITNLRLENNRLTWDLRGNVSRIKCYVNGAGHKAVKSNRYCPLFLVPKCETWNYTVHATVPSGNQFSAWIDSPRQEGNPRAAAEHLRCRIHDLHFLTCSWAVGAEAPQDVQYDFYFEDLSTSKKWPCAHYAEKEPGTHVQCEFANVSRLLTDEERGHFFRFVVQGASRHSRVPCSEIVTRFFEIEELITPTLTASCNKSVAFLEWKVSSHFTKDISYELKIEEDSGVPIVQKNLSKESWILPNPGTFKVTVRAHGGQWSARQRLVCDHKDEVHLYVWLTALTTLLAVGAAILLCKKYSVLQKLFPPIPRMKNPMGDTSVQEKMTAWQTSTASPEDCPVAQVQLVKEM